MEIRRSYNPLTLNYDIVCSEINIKSPNEIIKQENIVFIRPVVLLINGEPLLRKNWGNKLKQTDVCHFVELPGFIALGLFIGQMILYAAISYAIGYLYNLWFGPEPIDTVEDAEPVYSLINDVNKFRIGDPFPEHFGKFICFPPLVQQNYVEYTNTKTQYFYMLGIIGVGKYDVEDVYIDKTLIGEYESCTYNIIPPGGTPTLIPRLVFTSSAVSGQELSTNWLTITVTSPHIEISEIGIDIVFPSGLIHYRESGKISEGSATIYAYARKIDTFGIPLTSWTLIKKRRFEGSSTQILRYSLKCSLQGAARYEFRIKRNTPTTSSRVIDKCTLTALRGYGANHPDYGDVTLLEVKIKASEQLSGSVARKINCIATRKLYPVTATGFGGTEAVTKSIVDICAYIVTTENGGQQSDSTLDFDELFSMRTKLATRNNYFSSRFTKKTQCISALKQIARCGRCLPIQPGGLFSLVRDELKTSPSQIYTCDDYNEGSLQLGHAIRTDDDSTGVEVEYIDDETWQIQTVPCYDVGGSEDNLAKLQLVGCCDRQHAFEEGMYSFWDDELNRTTVSFTTGLKGLIPSIGDMIYVSSRQIDWGQTGQLAHSSATVATLSEPVNFGETSYEGKLLLTSKTGGVLGPYTVTPGDNAHSVMVALSSDDVNTIHAQGITATKFIFGLTTDEMLRVRVLKVLPQNKNEIKIEGSIIHDEVHGDSGTAPDFIWTPGIGLPYFDNLTIEVTDVGYYTKTYQLYWLSSESKFKVELDRGTGWILLTDELEAYSYEFTLGWIFPEFKVKVTPYIDDILTPAESKTIEYTLPGYPFGAIATSNKNNISLTWLAVTDADNYNVRVEYDGEDLYNESVFTEESVIPISELTGLTYDATPEINIFVKTTIDGVSGVESPVISWFSDFEAEDASTIFMCKTFNDSIVSGTPLLIRFQNQEFDYFYFKAYPTIGAEVGGTSDGAGSDFRGAIDSKLSGTPRIGKIQSGGTPYYYKQYPTAAADVESFSGITKSIININEKVISGAPRVARIKINDTNYYFKIYPTKE